MTAPSILVVDDDADHRMLMSDVLRRNGAAVREAATGEEALEGLGGVDLVLLDHGLPGRSGLEVLAVLMEGNGPSVVMVTANADDEAVVGAMRRGALDYVVKRPGYLDNLWQIVSRALRTHRLQHRANVLQRLALLVISEIDRDVVFGEIASGAVALLDAKGCALTITADDEVTLVATAGDVPFDDVGLRTDAATLLRRADCEGEMTHLPDRGVQRLAVPLPTLDGPAVGVLFVFLAEEHRLLRRERELAEAFAAYAGTGVQNVRRFELERRLSDEVRHTEETRKRLMAAVSHELRTPLTCISGFAETLDVRWDALDDAARRDLVVRVRQNAGVLQSMVDQLLEVAAIERSGGEAAHSEELVLGEQIEAAAERIRSVLRDRRLDMSVPATLRVMGDPALLDRVLANLLSNAVKFSPDGSTITVAARVQDADAVIEVSDEGAGLEQHEQDRVFDPFWRSQAHVTTDHRGAGLGLALVKQYIESMGGRVGVVSVPGEGATFRFTLPLAGPDPTS